MNIIAVIGAGYFGLSMADLLAGDNEVALVDVDKDKVDSDGQGVH